MDFCPKCNNILKPAKIEDKKFLMCRACGYKEEYSETGKEGRSQAFGSIKGISRKSDIVVLEEGKDRMGPIVEHDCDQCGNKEAYLTEIGPNKNNDEQSIYLFKCLRCGKTDRVKSSG